MLIVRINELHVSRTRAWVFELHGDLRNKLDVEGAGWKPGTGRLRVVGFNGNDELMVSCCRPYVPRHTMLLMGSY